MKRLIVGLATTMLVSGSLGLVDFTLAAGTAHAGGPYHWCPGQPMNNPFYPAGRDLVWDQSICHTWYYVAHAQGNVPYTDGTPSDIWDGDDPPAAPFNPCFPGCL